MQGIINEKINSSKLYADKIIVMKVLSIDLKQLNYFTTDAVVTFDNAQFFSIGACMRLCICSYLTQTDFCMCLNVALRLGA